MATSKIAGDAREKLRALLEEIVAGIERGGQAGGGRKTRLAGLVRADEALARYPHEFDHPGWAPLQSLD